MLNIYLAPKGSKSPRPASDSIAAVLDFLRSEGVVGASLGSGEYAPGDNAAILFHADADQHLLPVEITFEAFFIHDEAKTQFIPRDQDLAEFDRAVCSVCEEPVHVDEFEECFDRLALFPVDRVQYECPCCLSSYPFAQLDFGQPTAVASFWFQIEGAAFSRLNPALLDHITKLLGVMLLAVPEVLDDQVQEWASVREMRFR